jgi:SulP family sulfate permease
MKFQALLQEFNPRQLIPTLTAGLVIGITVIFFQTSLATLIFSGRLSPFVADGIGLVLFGGMLVSLAVTFVNSLPGAIPVVQDSPAAIFALAAAAIAAQMPAGSTSNQVYFTVVAALSITTVLAGLLFILIGRFGWSSFVRFVPYPVVGGFLAGTGWLLAQGAMGVMSGLPMHLSDLPRLFEAEMLIRWAPGAVLALLLLFLLRRFEHPLLMLGLLLGGTVVFYVALFLTHTSVADAAARGLLLGPFPPQALWRPLQPAQLAFVDWPLLLEQVGKLVTVLMVSSIALLLNASALELATRRDIDLNRELVAAGVGNILGGLGGSPIGYQTIGMSALAHRMGGANRLTTLIVALMGGAALLFGAELLSFFPKAVLGGLLLYLGLAFLLEWVYDAWRRLPHSDYFLVLSILVIVSAVGFLQGVGAGIVIAVILFVVNYSRVDFVKDTLTGVSYHSNVERPVEHRQLLHARGEQIHVLRLQGYLFFGTTQNLLNRVRERLRDGGLPGLRYLLLDFHRVAALDSSAVLGFVRLQQLAESGRIHLVVTDVRPQILARLAQGGLVEAANAYFHIFPNLDYGMEWCENRLLAEDDDSMIIKAATLHAQLRKIFASPEQIECFMKYLERMQVEKGHVLMSQGEPPEAMYFVDSGQVTAQLEIEPNRFIRLRSMGGGTVVGEMGLYLKQIRTATVFTSAPSVVYRLAESAMREMESEDPEVAAALHQWMVRLLAQRLSDNNQTLEVLLS